MEKRIGRLLVILACCLMIIGGARARETAASPARAWDTDYAPHGVSIDPGLSPLRLPEQTAVAVVVNHTPISRSEVDRVTDRLLMPYRELASPSELARARSQLWRQTRESLIDESLLLEAAEREGIRADKKAVRRQVERMINQFSGRREFRTFLSSLNISKKEFRREVDKSARIEALLERKLPPLDEVDESEVNAYYRRHPERFLRPERVRISQIFIAVSPEDTQEVRRQKRFLLGALRVLARRGADFGALARRYSEGPSRSRGGDLGYVRTDALAEDLRKAIFTLGLGAVTGIVETPYGYHLVKTTDYQDVHVAPLEEVHSEIVSLLEGQRKSQALKEYLLELRSAAIIRYTTPPAP